MEQFVVLMVRSTALECSEAVNVLKRAGIPNFIRDENVSNIFGIYNPAIGGVKLTVQARDREKAMEILFENRLLPSPEIPSLRMDTKCVLVALAFLLIFMLATFLFF